MSNQSAILDNPKWQTNTILSNAGSEYKFLWLFATFWNAITWAAIILGGENILRAFEESPVFYFFVLFPFIGLFMIYQAIKETLAWKRFGKTPMTMAPFPGQLGGVVGGYVDVAIPYNATHQVKISLRCSHNYWERSGGKSRTTTDVLWQDNISIQTRPSAAGSRIQFEFQPPVDLPESQPDGKDTHQWDVQIHFALPGNDYERKFTIPVIKASEQAIASATRYARQPMELNSLNTTSSDTDIPQTSLFSGGTRFYYPLFRSKGMGIALVIAGLGISVFLCLMWQEFASFIPVTSMLLFGFAGVGMLVLIFVGLYLIFNDLIVDVDASGVNVRHKIFGFSFGAEIERSTIADIVVEQSMSSTRGNSTRVWYSLTLIHKDGHGTRVGDTLEGSSYAESVRQKMFDALGSGWASSGYSEQQKSLNNHKLPVIFKTSGKILSLAFPAALIYDSWGLLFSLVNTVGSLL